MLPSMRPSRSFSCGCCASWSLGGLHDFIHSRHYDNDVLAELLGFTSPFEDLDADDVRTGLRQHHKQAEIQAATARVPHRLRANVARLADLVGLSAVDCRLLEFTVMLHNESVLDDTADVLGQLSTSQLFHALAVILDLPEPEVRAALGTHGILARSGLIVVDRCGTGTLRGKLDLLSNTFAGLMASAEADPVNLLRGMVSAIGPAHLKLEDYGHIQTSLDILCPYLRHATTTNQDGVNVFIHGAAGTGKSQLARVLAAELSCELFEVAGEDEDGDPIDGAQRLRAYRAAQSFFAQRRALIVFDEAEDVFDDGYNFFGRSTAQTRKAWINRMLEQNRIPTLWLSNTISTLDPAFIRRFDMVFELPVPPKAQRQRIVQQVCHDLIDDACAARIATAEALAPAVVTKAAAVIRSLGDELDAPKRMQALEHLIGNTLRAQGHGGLPSRHGQLPELYDPAFIKADIDLVQVARGLAQTGSGRLCLYGPPGTGKSAYARWLAEQLQVPLLLKRASDLMSAYIGDNERNIARTFREAEGTGALLLIDEIDSFLQDRRGASQNWEVTLVNEMLIQMESFNGFFIASTNLMDDLDPAALRRFDLKVRFGYLSIDQSIQLLHRYCTQLGLSGPAETDIQALQRLTRLAPGDFATAARQHRFRPFTTASELIGILQAECTLKGELYTPIGFVH